MFLFKSQTFFDLNIGPIIVKSFPAKIEANFMPIILKIINSKNIPKNWKKYFILDIYI